VFSADSRYLFYVRLDENHRPSRVFRHEIDTNPAKDTLIFKENDLGFFVGIGKTLSGQTILIKVRSHQTSEVWMIPADTPLSHPSVIAEREVEIEYSVAESDNAFYILTNYGGAEDFRIMTTSKTSPGKENWLELLAHKSGCLIQKNFVLKDVMVRLEREDGLPKIIIHDLSNQSEHEIVFNEETYALGLRSGYEFDTNQIHFSYSSMTTPSQIFDYNVRTKERVLRKEQEIPSGHSPSDYVTRRILAPAKDGETVPVSLVCHKDTSLDGSAPCLLYGYGSYGMYIPARFNSNSMSLVNLGFIYAIAHIRGGKEKGFRWYKEGRCEMKTNTFTDFLAVADRLVAQNMTSNTNSRNH